jgi:Niemann-Pick C1 protein
LQDSYVLDYFSNLTAYLSVGAPVYLVVKGGYRYDTPAQQNGICGGNGCPEDSLLGQVYTASLLNN